MGHPMIITLLGGAGFFARRVIHDYTSRLPEHALFVIADYDYRTARKMARSLGERFSARMVDVSNPDSFMKAAGESSLVVSFVGPWYRFGEKIIEGIARVKRPLILTNVTSGGLPEEKVNTLEEAGIPCVTGASLFPGAVNVMAEELFVRYPHGDEMRFTISIDTSRYGGLAFIREYFSLLSGGEGLNEESQWRERVKVTLAPIGTFQNIASSKGGGEPGIRTELLASLQDILRKKPGGTSEGALDLNISIVHAGKTDTLEPEGARLIPLMSGMLAGVTKGVLEEKEGGILTASDILLRPDLKTFVEKELTSLLEPVKEENSNS